MNSEPKRVILPGSTIGILGGGQLGRMIALAGRKMGYRFICLDPTPDAPCAQVCDAQVVAAYDDAEAARDLAAQCDVITYEFENVDARVVETLEAEGYVPQGAELLHCTQNRLREKTAVRNLGIPVAPFAVVRDVASLQQAVDEVGMPSVLKTAEGGYDGKGQWLITDAASLEQAREVVVNVPGELVLERFIRCTKELSVIVARRAQGEMTAFPVFENIHRENILHLSIAPARISAELSARAEVLAKTVAENLGVVGLLAVELFLSDDEQLYVNELAPRPHNSGHLSFDACATSQFEQHLRAICNLPLGPTELLTPAVMLNLIGEDAEQLKALTPSLHPRIKVHLYGKHETRPKRKMGHLTVLGDTLEHCLEILQGLPFPLQLQA